MCVREDVEFYRQRLTGDSCRSLGDQNAETVKSGLARLEVGASLKQERSHYSLVENLTTLCLCLERSSGE